MIERLEAAEKELNRVQGEKSQKTEGDSRITAAVFLMKGFKISLEKPSKIMTRGISFFTETPKVAFAASLGGNGLVKTTSGNKDLIYREVLTNVGGAYNAETGEIKI